MVNKCPACGGYLEVKIGKYGKFHGCSNYPNCHYTFSLNRNNQKNTPKLEKAIQINDRIKLKNKTNNDIVEYKIIIPYVEYIDVFDGFGSYGPKYNSIIKRVEGGNPDNPDNPTIASDSAIGQLLIEKVVGDTIKYNDEEYEILEVKKGNI
ncbi:MAG: topoisomerase DNA-binding C4 zinc finger domain-containing protein [Bacilli bacterium]|nr:topoisomerase DNA-binding C4 zinc finger domain-containing protein [Bacilli bacterium]